MLKAILMVGNVGSGKSTWIKKFLAEQKEEKWAVVSKDALRFMLGGGRYIFDPEVFEPYIDHVAKEMIEELQDKDINIIVDETNIDVIQRAAIVRLIWGNIETIAVVMPVIDKNESMLRKSKPETDYGYSIKTWEEVWERKNGKYVEPTKEEGFDEIILVEEGWRTK